MRQILGKGMPSRRLLQACTCSSMQSLLQKLPAFQLICSHWKLVSVVGKLQELPLQEHTNTTSTWLQRFSKSKLQAPVACHNCVQDGELNSCISVSLGLWEFRSGPLDSLVLILNWSDAAKHNSVHATELTCILPHLLCVRPWRAVVNQRRQYWTQSPIVWFSRSYVPWIFALLCL